MMTLREQSQEDTPRGKIIAAILGGHHRIEGIMKNACIGRNDFKEFTQTIAELKNEGLITYDKSATWGIWGYFFTQKAWNIY